MSKLVGLAWTIFHTFDCTGDADGNEPKPGDEGFDTHAYDQANGDCTEGCLHCMAADALHENRDTAEGQAMTDIRALAIRVATEMSAAGMYDHAEAVAIAVTDAIRAPIEAAARAAAERAKDQAYAERDMLVVLIARFALRTGGKAWLAQHPPDPSWDADWRTIVFIELLNGFQLTWHIHDSEVDMFNFLPVGDNVWDGHSTNEKYARLLAYAIKSIDQPRDPGEFRARAIRALARGEHRETEGE